MCADGEPRRPLQAFGLVDRAERPPPPPRGAVAVLLGVSRSRRREADIVKEARALGEPDVGGVAAAGGEHCVVVARELSERATLARPRVFLLCRELPATSRGRRSALRGAGAPVPSSSSRVTPPPAARSAAPLSRRLRSRASPLRVLLVPRAGAGAGTDGLPRAETVRPLRSCRRRGRKRRRQLRGGGGGGGRGGGLSDERSASRAHHRGRAAGSGGGEDALDEVGEPRVHAAGTRRAPRRERPPRGERAPRRAAASRGSGGGGAASAAAPFAPAALRARRAPCRLAAWRTLMHSSSGVVRLVERETHVREGAHGRLVEECAQA